MPTVVSAVQSPEPRHVHAADGTRIAYRVRGSGPPLLLANGLSTSEFFWHYLIPGWQQRHTVVTWDYKGHGDSEPARTDEGCRIEAMADDLRRVMDACEIERAPLVGFSLGSQVILEAWRQFAPRIAGLGFVLGPGGRLFDTALRPAAGPALRMIFQRTPGRALSPIYAVAGRLAKLPGRTAVGRWMRLYGRSTGTDLDRYVDHFGRLDAKTVTAIALAGGEHDARDALPSVDVPAVVIAGDRDVFAPAKTVGIPMHAAMPNAELVVLVGGTHGSLFEHHELIGAAIDKLLADVYVDGASAPEPASP